MPAFELALTGRPFLAVYTCMDCRKKFIEDCPELLDGHRCTPTTSFGPKALPSAAEQRPGTVVSARMQNHWSPDRSAAPTSAPPLLSGWKPQPEPGPG